MADDEQRYQRYTWLPWTMPAAALVDWHREQSPDLWADPWIDPAEHGYVVEIAAAALWLGGDDVRRQRITVLHPTEVAEIHLAQLDDDITLGLAHWPEIRDQITTRSARWQAWSTLLRAVVLAHVLDATPEHADTSTAPVPTVGQRLDAAGYDVDAALAAAGFSGG